MEKSFLTSKKASFLTICFALVGVIIIAASLIYVSVAGIEAELPQRVTANDAGWLAKLPGHYDYRTHGNIDEHIQKSQERIDEHIRKSQERLDDMLGKD